MPSGAVHPNTQVSNCPTLLAWMPAIVPQTRLEHANVGRRVGVRLADLEVDDRSAIGLERSRAGGGLERGLGAEPRHPIGDPHARDASTVDRPLGRTFAPRPVKSAA